MNQFYENCNFAKSPKYIFFYLISVAISIIFLYFLFKLKEIKCDCSNNWRRHFILIYTFINIFVGIIINYIFFCSDIEFSYIGPHYFIILVMYFIVSVLNLFYYVTTFIYVKNLNIEKCDCSKLWERDMMRIVSIIGIALSSLLLFLYLTSLFFLITLKIS